MTQEVSKAAGTRHMQLDLHRDDARPQQRRDLKAKIRLSLQQDNSVLSVSANELHFWNVIYKLHCTHVQHREMLKLQTQWKHI